MYASLSLQLYILPSNVYSPITINPGYIMTLQIARVQIVAESESGIQKETSSDTKRRSREKCQIVDP